MSRFKPMYQRLGISRTATVHCPHCKLPFFAHSLGAHVCRKAPHPTMDRRVVSFAEWKAAVARAKRAEVVKPKIGRAGL